MSDPENTMATRSSEVAKFVRKAKRAGVDIRSFDGNGHWAIYHQGVRFGTLAASPSDYRWLKNAMADIKRHTGIDLRPEHQRKSLSTAP